MVDTEDIKYVDSLVQEYLLFRGFTTCIKILDQEKKNDRLKGYHVSNIVSSLFSMVHTGNIQGVRELWNHLSDMFFSRLEDDLSLTVQKLDLSLKRYYVVYSVQSGHVDRALEFFKVCSGELASDKHWKAWFVLPYLKSPETDPNFSIFFGKAWVETFSLSLHNFLATIFQSVPLPKILNFNIERKLRVSLQNLNDSLMRENESLRLRNDKLRTEVDRLNKALQTTSSKLATAEQQLEVAMPAAAQLALLQQAQQQAQQTTFQPTQPSAQAQNNAGGATLQRMTSGSTLSLSSPVKPLSASNGDSGINAAAHRKPATTLPAPASTSTQPLPSTSTSTTPEGAEDANSANVANTPHAVLLQTSKSESYSTNSPVNCCKYSPDGAFIACGTQTGVTRIWPLGAQTTHRSATIYGNAEIVALAWDQDSKILLVGSGDGKVKVWNVAMEKSVGDITMAPYSRVRDIVCSPSGNYFACAASGLAKDPKASAIHLLNAKTLQLVTKIEFATTIHSFAFNHNESLIVAGGSDGHITMIGMDNKEVMSSWKAHVGAVLNVSYSPDYTSIYSVGVDTKLQRWDAHSSGKLLRQYNYAGAAEGARRVDLAFSQDSSVGHFVVPSKAETAPVYDRDLNTPILGIGTHKASITCCDWHPLLRQAMTGCLGGVVCLTTLVPTPSH